MPEEQATSPVEVVPTPSETSPAPAPVTTPTEPQDTAAPAEPAATGDWPDDWRQKYAGEDAKTLKRLERYASPKAALDALFAAQAKVAEKGTRMRDNATPEEVSAWRADNGIPESPTEYDVSLSGGRVWGEADKPLVDDFLKKANEANMQPAQVNQALDWYMSQQEAQYEAQQQRDLELRTQTEDELRSEFGGDYRRNVRAALDVLPADLKDQFLGGRMADGTLLGDNPAVIRWLVGIGRELNPMGTVVPGTGTIAMQAVEAELGTLRGLMGDRKSEYWKGPNAAKMQNRYRELLTAVERTNR
jgi:hypothetical protein